MKTNYSFVITISIISTIACSLFSTPTQPLTSETPLATSITIESTKKSDDGSRYPIKECETNEYGYINRFGELVISHQFEDAGQFHDGLAVVGDFGKINPDTYDLDEGKYGYIDINGEYVIEPQFPSASPFSEGLAAVASPDNPDLFGYIDKTGKFVIEPKYFGDLPFASDPSPDEFEFHEGYAVVPAPRHTRYDEYLFNYIDRNGVVLNPPGAVRRATLFSDGLAIIKTDYLEGVGGGTFLINNKGKFVAQVEICQSSSCNIIHPFSEELTPIKLIKNSKEQTGFINTSGSLVISDQFADAKSFAEGLAPALDNGSRRWGFIDRSGTVVIAYKYSMTTIFSEGLAWVLLPSGSGGYIDKTGNMIIPTGRSGEIFRNGLAFVGNGYIDKNGNNIYKTQSSYCP